ncbi:MAG TPA: hypothetical protein VKA92_08605, partial [Segetibacter sp.]|nr:hypothetical protein [Segetibacter sp.]
MIKAHLADKVFTGEEWILNHAIITEDDTVQEIVPKESIPSGANIINFPGGLLAPGFIDIQIYGAHGALLSVLPTTETLEKIFD